MKVFAIVLLAFVALFQISPAESEWIIEGGHGMATTLPPCPNLYEGLNPQQAQQMADVFAKMRERGLSKRPDCPAQPPSRDE